MALDLVPVRNLDDIAQWRRVHNATIPAHQLTCDDVRERLTRNRLSLAYHHGELVGNATVRPGASDTPTTVIVRILETHRRQGHGTAYWERLLAQDPLLRTGDVATVVLAANEDGLRFAEVLGFVEVERYAVGGGEYIDLIRRATRHRP